jgi:GMP synthase-like glutamine amidotransferase
MVRIGSVDKAEKWSMRENLRLQRIAVVDCFVIRPVVHCFNRLALAFPQALVTYHCPSIHGLEAFKRQEAISTYIILGSASHVTQNLQWHAPLAQFMVDELHRGKSVLGVCFGHQLLAHAFGSTVNFYNPAWAEEQTPPLPNLLPATGEAAGFYGQRRVKIVKSGRGLTQGQEYQFVVSHKQVIKKLSKVLEPLGESELSPYEIIHHQKLNFVGIQAHPEASEFFCRGTPKLEFAKEIMRVQNDGMSFIQNVLNSFHLRSPGDPAL